VFFSLHNPDENVDNPVPVVCYDVHHEDDGSEVWKGVPLQAAPPASLPSEVCRYGLLWEQTGPPRPVLQHAILEGVFITENHLKKVCGTLAVEKDKEQRGKKQWAVPLVKRFFPDISSEELDRLVDGICYARSTLHNNKHMDKRLLDALQLMQDCGDVENTSAFRDLKRSLNSSTQLLKEKMDEHDVGVKRAHVKVHHTPPHLKVLLPGKGELPHIYITRNPVLQQYRGYYPVPEGMTESCSQTWEGKQKNLPEDVALETCVDWIWRWHSGKSLSCGGPCINRVFSFQWAS
jgi:hypothetical protein